MKTVSDVIRALALSGEYAQPVFVEIVSRDFYGCVVSKVRYPIEHISILEEVVIRVEYSKGELV